MGKSVFRTAIYIYIIEGTRGVMFIIIGNQHDDLISLVWFEGISTIVGYLMPNSVYTYISDVYDWKT